MSVWQILALWFLLRHRKAQDEIADEVRNDIIRTFRTLKFEDLDGSQIAWVESTLPVIREGFEKSQMATSRFLTDYRAVHVAAATGTIPTPRPQYVPASEAVRVPGTTAAAVRAATRDDAEVIQAQRFLDFTSGASSRTRLMAPALNEPLVARTMLAAGPGTVKRAMPAPADVAMAKAMQNATGTAVRHAMDGGRGITKSEVENDELAMGFQRICDANPCYFCALLAANGPVYVRRGSFDKSNEKFEPNAAFEATGEPDGIAKVHNHCRCSIVPVFEEMQGLDKWGKVALSIWRSVRGKSSGNDAMNNYRKAFDTFKSSDLDMESDIDAETVREAIAEFLETLTDGDDDSVTSFLRSQARRLKAA